MGGETLILLGFTNSFPNSKCFNLFRTFWLESKRPTKYENLVSNCKEHLGRRNQGFGLQRMWCELVRMWCLMVGWKRGRSGGRRKTKSNII